MITRNDTRPGLDFLAALGARIAWLLLLPTVAVAWVWHRKYYFLTLSLVAFWTVMMMSIFNNMPCQTTRPILHIRTFIGGCA